MRFSLIAFAALACLSATPAQNRVWIVDKKGGTGVRRDTAGLMAAVRDGDLILLRQGDYSGIGIHDKSVTIVHDTRTGPASLAFFGVSGLSAGKNVTLRGVRCGPVTISKCTGSVALDRCALPSSLSNKVVDSGTVTFSGCALAGGLFLTKAAVQLHGSRVKPGFGDGVTVDSASTLVASECQLTGSDGRPGVPRSGQCYFSASAGGHGLRVLRYSRVSLTNCVLAGGKPAAANPPCKGAPGGLPMMDFGAVLTRITRPSRSLRANSPVREGEKLSIEIGGQSGDEAFLLFNLFHDAMEVPGCGAALFPSLGNIGVLYVGRVGNGTLKVEVPVQPMAAATRFTPLHTQALLLPKTGCVLSPPASIVLLDEIY